MREIDFLDAVGQVDAWYMEECISHTPPKKKKIPLRYSGAIAACFVLVIVVSLIANFLHTPHVIDENGFYIEDGVLLRYTGSDTDITIPDEVETIADYTFLNNRNAQKIEVIRLGTNVQKIECNAFAGLDHLIDLIIAENNLSFVKNDGLLLTSDGSILLRYERTDEVSFTIPDTVRFIAAHAVQGTKLEEIDFGENLEFIGYNAFAGNYHLKAIYLPDSIQYISAGAFSGCTSAIDGSIPAGIQSCDNSFEHVPFYLSLLAGQMSPLEEIRRGLISPSEAILQSNLDSLTAQIEFILATLRGDDYEADDAAMFAYGAVHELPEIPDGMTIPESFTLDDLTFTDNGWGATGIYDVQIQLQAGDYTLVMEAYGYETHTALYWKDIRFRIARLYYVQNPDSASSDDTVTAFGWTAVFGRNGDLYSGITYTREDGTLLRSFIPAESDVPYVLTFSPNGTRVAVEYVRSGTAFCYIQSLNGDVLMEPNYDYNEYLNRYYGSYKSGSLRWTDEDNLTGENEFGRFSWNIYKFSVTQLDDDPALYDPENNATQTVEYSINGYTIRMEIPLRWRNQNPYRDLVRSQTNLDDSRGYAAEIYGNMPQHIFSEIKNTAVQTNANGFSYYVVRDATTSASTLAGEYYCIFEYDTQLAFYLYVVVYKDDPEDYLQTVIQPILDSVAIEPDILEIDVDSSSFQDTIQSMGDNNALPSNSYALNVYDLSAEVCLQMSEYDIPESITAYGQTLEIHETVYLYGNCHANLFEIDGVIVFTWDYYNIGCVYILGDGFSEVLEPGNTASVMLYLDNNGALKYRRTNNHIADIIQGGGLTVATGYDDFLYSIGSASITDGTLVLDSAKESCTIGDRYDLDKEFVELGYSRDYPSIEAVFARNQARANDPTFH